MLTVIDFSLASMWNHTRRTYKNLWNKGLLKMRFHEILFKPLGISSIDAFPPLAMVYLLPPQAVVGSSFLTILVNPALQPIPHYLHRHLWQVSNVVCHFIMSSCSSFYLCRTSVGPDHPSIPPRCLVSATSMHMILSNLWLASVCNNTTTVPLSGLAPSWRDWLASAAGRNRLIYITFSGNW